MRYIGQVSPVQVISSEIRLTELSSSVDSAATIFRALTRIDHHIASSPCFVWEVSTERPNADGVITFDPARYSTLIFQPTTIYSGSSFSKVCQELKVVWQQVANGEFPLAGGAVGFVAWDAVDEFEKIARQERAANIPAVYMISCERGITLDRQLQVIHVWHVVKETTVIEARAWCEKISQQLRAMTSSDFNAATFPPLVFRGNRFSPEQFVGMVQAAREYIVAGDVFQVVLSNSLEFQGRLDPLALFERLQAANRSPYHFAVRYTEDDWYVGASPEVMLRSRILPSGEHEVYMRPVAGTYPRHASADDLKIIRTLSADPKERAEHLMLVDLERNDIGRTAKLGSVEVSDLFDVETYQSVHHLVSQVRGLLDARFTVMDALRAAFPIGTLSGTPKVRALEIIAELEGKPRGIFGGAVVTVAPGGTIDSCVAIRAAQIQKERLSIQTGAGIVYDSIPEREFNECLWKARSLISAISLLGSCPEHFDLQQLTIDGFGE